MRRLRVEYLESATADLERIVEVVRRMSASTRTARGYAARIRRRCQQIGDAPHQGSARDDLLPSLRTVGFERRVLIAYRVEAGRVRIVNVLYGGRDVDAFYRSGDPEGGDDA